MTKATLVLNAKSTRPTARKQAPVNALDMRNLRSATRKMATSETLAFLDVYKADPFTRVALIKGGVSAHSVEQMAKQMAMPREKLFSTLGLARATVDRKKREDKPLSSDNSERVLGMARLVGQIQAMVQESGAPTGFNAAEWVARWLEQPLPAFGGKCPASFMDTAEGQSIVSNMLARIQSGAYA